jgi:hypothetical protein
LEMRMFVGLFGDGGVVLAVEEVCKWSGLLGAVQMVRPLGCCANGQASWVQMVRPLG